MADEQNDPNNQTKVGAKAPGIHSSLVSDDTVLDELDQKELDAIDVAISKIDPNFQKQLEKIGPNEEFQNEIVEGFSLDFTIAASAEVPLSVGERIRKFPRTTLVFFKRKFVLLSAQMSDNMRTFKYSSGKKKASILIMVALFGAASYVGYRTVTKGLFPREQELFVSSMKDWSQASFVYGIAETEYLYESTHSAKNIMVIPRMVVNLKRSKNSGENPMVALEFYIEGTAAEVMVEVKDREAEVKDLLQRNIEDMNFDQISSAEGKQLLCERLRKEVNKILTTGKIRKFFIKTVIVKS